jgi:hypothetical protein
MMYLVGSVLVVFTVAMLVVGLTAGVPWRISLVQVQLGLLGVGIVLRASASDALKRRTTAAWRRLLIGSLVCLCASLAIGVPLLVSFALEPRR